MFAYLDSQTSLEDVVLSSSDEEDFIEDCVIDEFPLLTALRLNSLEEKNAKFRRFPDGKLIPVEDYYTELAVVERQAHVSQMEEETASSMEEAIRPLQVYESIYQPSFTIAMKDLFKSENKVADKKSTFSPNRIVLVGRAGVGKTTLCNKLVHDFYREGLWPEKGFAAIVHIPLRELINKSVTSLGAAIREFCLLQRDKQRLSIEVINDTLADENIRDKILYVLDGYDEIAPHLTNNPLLNDLLTSFSEEAHWIITSRPLAIPGSVFDAACDRRVENIGFNTEQVYQFVDCYFNGDEERDEQEIARLLRTGEALAAEIRQNVNLQGIMHVPINSQLVCYVYEQELISINSSRKRTPLQWQDLTMTRLYDKLVYQLVRRYLLRCYEMEKDDKEKQRIQSLHEGRCAEKVLAIPEVKQLLDFLESVAWLAMEKKDILFSFNESKNKSLYDVLKKTSKVHYRRLCLPEKKQQQFERVLQRIREKIRRGEEVKEEKFKAIGTLVTQYPALYSELESLYKSDEDFKDLDPFETFFIKLDLPSDEESTAAMMTSMQNFIRIITQELGLLTNTGEQASVFSEENAYYFLHLTFQEYFAARY
ncbi:MAG: NACHT domain-containing protein, partial [Gammaproteobacteria bacterium]